MFLKKIIKQLNIPDQCRQYGFSLWQCPPFLFLVMGIIIIFSNIITYAIAARYIEDPSTVALIVLILTAVLFIVTFSIFRSFERLAEANRMKSEFVRIVSHQLRAPTTNILWVIDVLLSGNLGKIEPKQIEYFEILKENIGRTNELIKDLLFVSRIQESSLPLKKEKLSLIKIVEKLISRFQPFTKASNVKIKFSFDEKLPEIFSDLTHIETLIENLIDNAVRYIEKNGEIEISLAKKNNNVYFEIKDNGVGIPEEDQKYIFQKFFRAKNIKEIQPYGSGLGLFIAKSIADRLGGKIGFKSQENIGTTFWFTLPIK
jgi:signal transduction histidine kinase